MGKEINIEDSVNALKRAYKKLGKKRIDEIIADIKAKNICGPTLEQYFLEFENHFDLINNNDNTYSITEVHGNPTANLLYSVIIIDLVDCDVKFYGGNNDAEVAAYLYEEGYRDMDFILKIVGKKRI